MKKLIYFSLILTGCCLLIACAKEEPPVTDVLKAPNLPASVYDYTTVDFSMHPELSFVIGGGEPPFSSIEEWVSDEGATLGRVLFYDTKLSVNNRISCGSCHQQQLGFGDLDRFSEGFNDQVTMRNSMSLANLIFMDGFFWDLRTRNLEELILMPIQNHIEMGMENIDVLTTKLSDVDYYPDLFADAFGTPEVTSERISSAVAQFLRSMISLDAKYDQGRPADFSNFTPLEQLGKQVFLEKAGCGNCHNEPTFDSRWGGDAANIGLDLVYEDPGVGASENPSLSTGFFKIPSLRNVALTAPYMHDGRFNTLEEVVDHYNEGIQNHPFLDWRLRNTHPVTGETTPIQLNLSEMEKLALVAFLKTLTDESYLHDARFSNPFK